MKRELVAAFFLWVFSYGSTGIDAPTRRTQEAVSVEDNENGRVWVRAGEEPGSFRVSGVAGDELGRIVGAAAGDCVDGHHWGHRLEVERLERDGVYRIRVVNPREAFPDPRDRRVYGLHLKDLLTEARVQYNRF